MTAEQNKAVLRRFFDEAWHRKRASIAHELFAPQYVLHDPGNLWISPGAAGVREMIEAYNNAFPDASFAIELQIAEGDVVVTRWSVHSTHRGDLLDVHATNRESTTSGILFSHLRDGLIAEEWTQWNKDGLLRQLGVLPANDEDRPGT